MGWEFVQITQIQEAMGRKVSETYIVWSACICFLFFFAHLRRGHGGLSHTFDPPLHVHGHGECLK